MKTLKRPSPKLKNTLEPTGVGHLVFLQSLFAHVCHDLVSPLSALCGGLELYEDQKMTAEEVFPILNKSLDTLRWRLEILRASVGLNGNRLSLARAFTISSEYLAQGKKIQLLWELRNPIEENRSHAQIVLTAVLWFAHRAPKGMGVLHIKESPQGLHFTLHAPMVILSADESAILSKELTVENDPFLSFTQYFVELAKNQDYKVVLAMQAPDEVSLTLARMAA